ncbi:hypothetical protein CVS40_4826 [Lucilia cuprina]|nr:hypothetical protein CVS40_4826 [Lucilia cuprina]
MVEAVVAFLLMEEESCQRINRKILRDHSNPLELPESVSVRNRVGHRKTSTIPCVIQLLAATLRFLAEGSYQRSVGNDSTISLSRSPLSVVLSRVLKVLLKYVSPQWIKLRMDESEKRRSIPAKENPQKLYRAL